MSDKPKTNPREEAAQLIRALIDRIKTDIEAGTVPADFVTSARALLDAAEPHVIGAAFGQAIIALALAEMRAE
ncbi:hypothetical protein [Microbacterium sp. XT11]|uniref:hypothetical protein n=1 Tax=Microbacterium sp. XT11 TaxID=367477 RepID=UPI00082E50B7|nr:hypothetical protein [Microbacterium sp. XT11]